MKTDLQPLSRISDALAAGTVSPEALLEASLQRIGALDGRVHAFLRLTEKEARAAASASSRRRAAGETPGTARRRAVALKDIFCTEGVETTVRLEDPPGLRPALRRHRGARGCSRPARCILGKLNMDEFAMGSSNENSRLRADAAIRGT